MLCSGEACPICRRQKPLDIIAELETSWVTMQESAPLPGYVCLVSRTHVVDLHELSGEVAEGSMRDAQRVSKAISAATGAVKLNYEIHGNSLPHLHMHFFPRYRGDRFEGRPIDPKSVSGPVYAKGEFQRTRDAFLFPWGSRGMSENACLQKLTCGLPVIRCESSQRRSLAVFHLLLPTKESTASSTLPNPRLSFGEGCRFPSRSIRKIAGYLAMSR